MIQYTISVKFHTGEAFEGEPYAADAYVGIADLMEELSQDPFYSDKEIKTITVGRIR